MCIMKILLINPPYHDVYSMIASAEGISPPLGLAYIAAFLRDHGHEVRIIDANAEEITLDKLGQHIPEGFDIVGTTSFTPSVNNSGEVLRLAKAKFTQIRTIMGGAHITVAGKETMDEFPEIDFGIVGEGERTALELIDSLAANRPVCSIKGLIFREGTEVIQNERRSPIENLDNLSFPAYDLLPTSLYRLPIHHVGFGHKVPIGPFSLIFTSRGCPMNCTFCASKTIWGKRVRYRSAEDVLSEVRMLVRDFGVKVIDIADDIFTINKKRLHMILDGIIDMQLNMHFNCLSRVDTITRSDIRKMKRAGCYLIRYGVESGSQKILKRMRKNIEPEQAIRAFRMTNEAGIACTASFIIGHPGETEETVKETIDLAKRLNSTLNHFFMAVPYPGTELYRIAKREKLILEDTDWKHWIQFPEKGVLRTEALDQEDLAQLRKKAYREVYFSPMFLWKSLKRIKTWDHVRMYIRGALAVWSVLRIKR